MKAILAALVTAVVMFSVQSCISFQPIVFTEAESKTAVFDSLSGSKSALYLKANDWMIQTFTNAKSVIQHQDKEEGVIIGKYLMHANSNGMAIAEYYAIIDIQVKDQKARIMIKPTGEWKYGGSTIYDYTKPRAIADMNRLASSFRDHLLKERKDF